LFCDSVKSSTLKITADFKTALMDEQNANANYGIKIYISLLD
jgi:hypothetical protein